MFYTFNQNNSGGRFSFNEKAGITHFVIIEADNVDEANSLAEDLGIYFNGCDDGRDCPCCGDRWYPVDNDSYDCKDSPVIYGKSPKEYVTAKDSCLWMNKGKEACVHYKNGKKVWY